MKNVKRMIYSSCAIFATGLMLWSCASDYARTDITLEMTDEDSVDAIIDHDLLTVGGTIINIEEPQETHTPVVEYVDEIDITTPEYVEDDIEVLDSDIDDSGIYFDEQDDDVIESVEIEDDTFENDFTDTDEISISDKPESSVALEENITVTDVDKIDVEPINIEEIISSEPEKPEKQIKTFSIPSDEDVEKLRDEVDALVNKPHNKKSLSEFVVPAYSDKRVKVTYPTHTVKRGDTLWLIGRKYGCSISDLCAANNISRRKVLSIGQSLTIPISNLVANKSKDIPKISSDMSGEIEMPPPVVDKPKTIKTQYYTVQKGDSYWKIARKYGVNSPELMRINNTSSTLIKPGQKILVPKR